MRRFLAALLALVVLPLLPAQAAEFDRGLLWRVEVEGKAPSYLYGSMHSSDPEVLASFAAARPSFDASTTVITEIIETPEAMAEAMAGFYLPEGQQLKDRVTPETYARLEAAMTKVGIPMFIASRLRPWAAAVLLAIEPAELKRLQAGLKPLDSIIQEEATRQGKVVAALETVEEQLGVFIAMPEGMQIRLLESTLESPEFLAGQQTALKEAYLAGDLAALERLFREASEEEVDRDLVDYIVRELLVSRNHRMAERLVPYLEAGGSFVAVGALHLPGEEGVLQLLSDRGYRLSRVE